MTNKTLEEILRRVDHSGDQPCAVFDCDDTMIKGDIGEAMLFHQLERFHFRVSPGEVWPDHPGRKLVDHLFGELRSVGDARRASHSSFDPFANMILDWYYGRLAAGEIAGGCADIVKLFAGFTSDETRAIARDVLRAEINAPVTRTTLGRHTVARGIRYMETTYRLMQSLVERGIRVVAVSGSNQWSVEAVFHPLGLQRNSVIGIDLVEDEGVLTDRVIEPIPVHTGKVDALNQRYTWRPVVCVSDSLNDVPLLLHATHLRVLVRSSYSNAFFERAGIAQDSSWLIIEDGAVFGRIIPPSIVQHSD